MTIFLSGMKSDIAGILTDWGTRATFSRFSGSLNSTGRVSGAWVNFASATVNIQPAGGSGLREYAGLIEGTTHILYGPVTVDLDAENRVAVAGESYSYDVVYANIYKTHVEVQLKRTKRT